jgi:biotin operon repressor
VGKSVRKRLHGNLGVDRTIIIKYILRKWGMNVASDRNRWRAVAIAGINLHVP